MANAFEAELQESAKALGIYYQRLPLPPRNGQVILKKNPYDSFFLHQTQFNALEAKSMELHGNFSFKKVKDHQVEGLQAVLAEGCPAWLFVNMRREVRVETRQSRNKTAVGNPITVTTGRQETISRNQAWALPFGLWHLLQGSCTYKNGKPRGTVLRAQFDDPAWFIPLPRTSVETKEGKRVPVWDLRVLWTPNP